MKINLKSLVVVSALVAGLYACSKDNDDTTPTRTKTELISAHSWRMTAILFDGVDIFSSTDSCDWDNIYTYSANGNYTEDAGPWKCDPSDPQVLESSTWAFSSNETVVSIAPGTPDQSDFNLIELNADNLKYSQSVNDSIFGSFTVEVHFVRY